MKTFRHLLIPLSTYYEVSPGPRDFFVTRYPGKQRMLLDVEYHCGERFNENTFDGNALFNQLDRHIRRTVEDTARNSPSRAAWYLADMAFFSEVVCAALTKLTEESPEAIRGQYDELQLGVDHRIYGLRASDGNVFRTAVALCEDHLSKITLKPRALIVGSPEADPKNLHIERDYESICAGFLATIKEFLRTSGRPAREALILSASKSMGVQASIAAIELLSAERMGIRPSIPEDN